MSIIIIREYYCYELLARIYPAFFVGNFICRGTHKGIIIVGFDVISELMVR
jgi:hypothetical protein